MQEGTYYSKNREKILARLKKKYREDEDFRVDVNYRNIRNYRKIMANEQKKEEYTLKRREYMREYMRNRKKSSK